MNEHIRILHLEDERDFSELIHSLLQKEGIDAEIILAANRAEFEAALDRERFDLILADYLLPDYDGLQALRRVRAGDTEIPFLLVSGTIGEEAAIESLKNGATDYVLKMHPERLLPAMRRAIDEAREKQKRRKIEIELLSQRKAAEEMLRESEEQYRLVFDGNPVPMWIFDQESLRFLEINDAAVQYYGYSREEFLSMTLKDLRPPEEVPGLIEYLHTLVHNPAPAKFGFAGVWKHRRKSGSCVEVEIKWSPISFKGQRAFLTLATDVTERKRLEHRDKALSKLGKSLSSATSPKQAAEIIHAITDDLFRSDVFTLDLYSEEENRVYPVLNQDTDRTGRRFYIPTETKGRPPSQRARRVITQGAELELRKEPLQMPSDTIPIGDVSRPSASLMLVPIRDRTKVLGVLSIQSYALNAYDASDLNALQALADHCGGALERISAESALHHSEMLFHSIWENSVDGMRLTDSEGTIIAVNEAFCQLVGLPRYELEGEPLTVIYAESQQPERILQKYRERFRSRIIEKQIERRLTLRNGNVVTLEDTNSFVEITGQPPLLLGLFRDITAQKKLEEQLRQSQKMEAIGQLAGGVAHDFNNILTVIHGHASLLLSNSTLTGTSVRSAQQIGQAAERAAALTRQLLTFSRRQVIQPRSLDLNEVISNMTRMLGRLLGEDVALQLQYSPQPAWVKADASMMEQVLLNLAVNARDAMPKGGKLTIRIGFESLQTGEEARHPDARPGRFVCLTASDTGCGIFPEILPRIFEPFFTTKEVGKGTGLGLATVYGILKQHDGWIEVDSEPARGSTFRVFLPMASRPAGMTDDDHSAEAAVRGGNETILVVEDELPVRELVCSLLSARGYKILQAESGAKALELWKTTKEKIDLVLTDLVMPDRVNGRELAEKLWTERPKLKVIFTSGYSADVVGNDFVLRDGLNYLQKPYHPIKLARAVRECLDAVN
jgi:two-component system cell cycle sensor histidine kinase/response regulator CckA